MTVRYRSRGFSLVELLVSLALLGLTLAMVTGMFYQCARHQSRSQAITQSMYHARQLIAEAEVATAEQRQALPAEGRFESEFPYCVYQWRRSFEPTPEGLLRVRVQVSFQLNRQEPQTLNFAQEVRP